MLQTMIDNMPEKTGKPLEDWLVILKEKAFAKHGEAVKFLKTEYGMTHGFANTIVHLSKEDSTKEVDLVEQQYQGKDNLKPIYLELKKLIETFGKDIEFAPKKAYISVRRKKQFAIIQPSTKSRLDLGINLKGKTPEGQIEAAGSWNTMCTHRVRMESATAITPEVQNCLKEAYDAAG